MAFHILLCSSPYIISSLRISVLSLPLQPLLEEELGLLHRHFQREYTLEQKPRRLDAF